jgi:hypothetical protein
MPEGSIVSVERHGMDTAIFVGRPGGLVLGLMYRRVLFSKAAVVVYIVVGLLVANSHHYFAHLGGAKAILSAALGVVLWPLVVLGVDLHIN